MRYFYTDALKAAWMSKENGVDISDWPLDDLLYWASCFCGEQSPSDPVKAEKFYIHPDCHAMLLPQEGDTIREGANVAMIAPDHHEYRYADYITMKDAATWGVVEIIQRNGKAWFTPEREEV